MKLYPSLTPDLIEWIVRQPIFFTGSAPTHGSHCNVSPKGLASSHFAVLSPNQCAYIDRTGSGCETIAHAYDNGRLTLMFNSFGPAPRIIRLFCRARVVELGDPGFPDEVRRIVDAAAGSGAAKGKAVEDLLADAFGGARAVIVCDIFQAQTSCGFGVPMVRRSLYQGGDSEARYDEELVFEDRDTMGVWSEKMTAQGKIGTYRRDNNSHSMDGLPGLRSARRDAGQYLWLTDAHAWLWSALGEKRGFTIGLVSGFLFMTGMSLMRAH